MAHHFAPAPADTFVWSLERQAGSVRINPKAQPWLWGVMVAVFVLEMLQYHYFLPLGLGLSPDSSRYVHAAHALWEQGYLADSDGQPLTLFAPGYSILLGLVFMVIPNLVISGYVLNSLCIAVTIFFLAALVVQCTESRWAGLFTAVFLFLAPGLYFTNMWFLTEVPYLAFVSAGLYLLVVAIKTHRLSFGAAITIGVMFGFAVWMRYFGLILLPLLALALLLIPGIKRYWKQGATALAVYAGFLLLLIVRNYAADGTVFGRRSESIFVAYRWVKNYTYYSLVYLFPGAPLPRALGVSMYAIVAVVVVALLYAMLRSRVAFLLVSYAAAGMVLNLVSAVTSRVDTPNFRILATTIPFVSLVLVIVFYHALVGRPGDHGQHRPRLTKIVAAFLAVALIVGSINAVHYYQSTWLPSARDAVNDIRFGSATGKALRELPPETVACGHYRDWYAASYLMDGAYFYRRIPMKADKDSKQYEAFVKFVKQGKIKYLYYSDPVSFSDVMSPDELRAKGFSVAPISEGEDGGFLYSISEPGHQPGPGKK